jgi:uncharacterized protein with GYD domain
MVGVDRVERRELNPRVPKGGKMPTYVVLFNWTDEGVKGFKDTVDRYEKARELGAEAGITWREIYWTLGPYDIVATLDAPDDEALMSTLLAVAGQGNIRTTTLRAFDAGSMRAVIEKAG